MTTVPKNAIIHCNYTRCFPFAQVYSFIWGGNMKFMKGLGKVLCFLLAVILLSSSVFVSAEQDFDNSIANGCHTLDAVFPLLSSAALSNTESAILYETNSDTLIYAWNPDEIQSPSSLTKLVTAIIAIEQADLSETVVADGSTLSSISQDAVSAGIQAGEEISLLDLLYCMLVGSANDAAAVIAVHMDGSINQFAQRMNAFITSIGCTSSNFTNPHGLHDNSQYTTARDAAKVLAYASKNETFSKLIGTKDYTVPATNKRGERNLSTNNYLINRTVMSTYYDARVTGGRTGVTNDGKRCVAATARQGTMNLISVVMGCRSTYSSGGATSIFGGFPETTALLDRGFHGLSTVQVLHPGQVLKQYPLANADADLYIGVQESYKAVLPYGVGTNDLRYVFEESGPMVAPVEKDAPLGIVNVYYGSNCIASAPLFALNAVYILQEDLITDRAEDPKDGPSTGLILVVIAVAFVLVLLFLRYSKKFRKIVGRKRRRRRRV